MEIPCVCGSLEWGATVHWQSEDDRHHHHGCWKAAASPWLTWRAAMQHNSSPATSTRTTIHNLNARTLQTVVTAITKDLCVDWSGEIPTWWSEDIPFCKPCTIPPSHKGTLLDEVEHEFHVCTNRNSLCIYVCMYIMHLLHLSTYFHAGHWCDALRRVTDMLV